MSAETDAVLREINVASSYFSVSAPTVTVSSCQIGSLLIRAASTIEALTAAQAEIAALRKDAERWPTLIEHWREYWNGDYNEGAMKNALDYLMAELDREYDTIHGIKPVDAAIDASKG